jgi:hypothetical protein
MLPSCSALFTKMSMPPSSPIAFRTRLGNGRRSADCLKPGWLEPFLLDQFLDAGASFWTGKLSGHQRRLSRNCCDRPARCRCRRRLATFYVFRATPALIAGLRGPDGDSVFSLDPWHRLFLAKIRRLVVGMMSSLRCRGLMSYRPSCSSISEPFAAIGSRWQAVAIVIPPVRKAPLGGRLWCAPSLHISICGSFGASVGAALF